MRQRTVSHYKEMLSDGRDLAIRFLTELKPYITEEEIKAYDEELNRIYSTAIQAIETGQLRDISVFDDFIGDLNTKINDARFDSDLTRDVEEAYKCVPIYFTMHSVQQAAYKQIVDIALRAQTSRNLSELAQYTMDHFDGLTRQQFSRLLYKEQREAREMEMLRQSIRTSFAEAETLVIQLIALEPSKEDKETALAGCKMELDYLRQHVIDAPTLSDLTMYIQTLKHKIAHSIQKPKAERAKREAEQKAAEAAPAPSKKSSLFGRLFGSTSPPKLPAEQGHELGALPPVTIRVVLGRNSEGK